MCKLINNKEFNRYFVILFKKMSRLNNEIKKTVLGLCQRCINTNRLLWSFEGQILKNNGRFLRFNVDSFISNHQVPDNSGR